MNDVVKIMARAACCPEGCISDQMATEYDRTITPPCSADKAAMRDALAALKASGYAVVQREPNEHTEYVLTKFFYSSGDTGEAYRKLIAAAEAEERP